MFKTEKSLVSKLYLLDLMPMGNGYLFLPVKAEIRMNIKKQAGDYVKLVLFADNLLIEIPEELIQCF
ncbi:DUF1905 domain-containing protein [Sediminibacterium sp.]|uniref:DUF1905 domain-containing protein n=1 Tax=Sediminibacterium sp. TaxID=1917865 RepID=UPI003F722800